MDENEKQRLRAEYMRGDIDWVNVCHALVTRCGASPDEAQELGDRWQRAKVRAFNLKKDD